METKVITKEIYSQLDEFSYTISKLQRVSFILSELMIDSDFKQVDLEGLATIIHDRISTLNTELINFLHTIDPYN